MDAFLWTATTTATLALGLLRCISPHHAHTALRAALGLWTTVTLIALPILLAK